MIADSQQIFGHMNSLFDYHLRFYPTIFQKVVSYCRKKGTYRRTRIAMERLFGIDRSRGKTETVCVKRNDTYVEQSVISRSYVLTLIIYESCTPTELSTLHLAAEAQTQASVDECALKTSEPTAKCQCKRGRRGTRRKHVRTDQCE